MFQVVIIGFDLGKGHHACVARQGRLPFEHVHDLMDVLAAQTVFVAVFHKAFTGVDHEDAGAGLGMLLVDHDDTSGNAGAVKKVGRQTDDSFDVPPADQVAPDMRLDITPEQHAVGQNHRCLAGAFQGFDDVQQKGIVPVFGRRCAVFKAFEGIVGRVDAVAPGFVGKGRIGHRKIKSFEAAVLVFPVRIGQGVIPPDFVGWVAMQKHIHSRQGKGGVVHFLPENGKTARGFIGGFQQQ